MLEVYTTFFFTPPKNKNIFMFLVVGLSCYEKENYIYSKKFFVKGFPDKFEGCYYG